MTIFCWNCRGFGETDDPTIPYLHRCVLKYHPLILFLQETHTNVEVATTKTAHLGFPNFFGVDSIGRSGGLLLYWDSAVDINILCSNPRFIFCKLGFRLPQGVYNDMYIMFIYGESKFELHSDKFGGSCSIRGQVDFTSWKLQKSLVDVPFFGPRFTWMNGQYGNDYIMERLDRAYASQDWFDISFPDYLTFFPTQNATKRPYRIDNWCLHLPEVVNLVRLAFQTSVLGSLPYVLSRKLASVRFAILNWVIQHRVCYGINWSSIEHDLENSATDISDLATASNYQVLRSNQLQTISKQHRYWLQRVKLREEVLDGLPTRFLFNRVRQRMAKQHLVAIRTPAGVWLHEPAEVESEILTFFRTLWGASTSSPAASSFESTESFLSNLDLPSLSSADCSVLSAPFSDNDVLCALRTMDGSKSPGPDGITPRFDQYFWPQIGSLVSAAVVQFLNSGVMLKEWNCTHIVLIPKIDHPELVTHYRPISLCNVIYRIASKCLANRLKLVIPSIISDSQQAFVPGRLMSDGCLVAHEVLHYINKTKGGTNCYAVLKLDMSKAFDRVSWHLLMALMRHMGFPIHWRNIVWECISTVSYRILVNGAPSAVIKPSYGLRQGDPISPYLFIICMEVLSRQLARAERMKTLTGIKISRYEPTLSHLFYADDALLCCKATHNSFEALRDLLKDFELVSGQMINLDKSYIKFSPNTPEDFRTHVTSILKMPMVSSFGDYLGVPIDVPRKRSEVFFPLIDKITTRIASWSALHLSQPSKLIIISAILLASLNHILSYVPIPLGVCRKIDALIAAFWWRSDWRKNTIHWLNRDILHAPKDYGGLGIKNTFLLGQSLLLKNFWRITSQPTTLLAKLWSSKYQKDLPIPNSRSVVSNASYSWSGLCRAVNVSRDAICWKLGSGKLINIWSSRWVNGDIPIPVSPAPDPPPQLSSFTYDSGEWNPIMLFRYFSPETAKSIIAMESPAPDIDDFIYWKFTEDGVYTAKSGYSFLWSQSSAAYSARPMAEHFPWHIVWRKTLSCKMSLLLWRMLHNILPTNVNLISRGMNIEPACPFCHASSESMDHLFRSCLITQHLWKSSTLGINSMSNPYIPFTSRLMDLLSYFSRQSYGSTKDVTLIYFCCLLCAIWISRNLIVFQSFPMDPGLVYRLTDDLVCSNTQLQMARTAFMSTAVCSFPLPITGPPPVPQAGISIALLKAMKYAHQANYSQVTFHVTCRKLSSVLATTLPVPIDVRNSLLQIRTLFVLHPLWSVSLVETG
ncbi:uncharacterized protein LOC141629796 [Silene latifolia]|uniref:uncharacterized protein LOC141629796 n=1 Tax=Silene latifolia TaxID=37657 RepID=UPI003D76AD8A